MRSRLTAALLLSLASTGAFATQTTYEYTGFLHGQIGYPAGESPVIPYDTQFVASFTYDDAAGPGVLNGNTTSWANAVKYGQISFFNNEGDDLGTMWNKDRTGDLYVVNDYKDQFSLTMMLASRPDDPANVRWFLRFATLSDSTLLGPDFSLENPLPIEAMLAAPSFSATVGYAAYDEHGNEIPDSFRAVDARVLTVSVPEPATMSLVGLVVGAAAFTRRRKKKDAA
ncbi:MAG TPA: PEP-CTERM sorting domain-containing protein [Steroidobacteraceae bacterium]|nr:PEP-CTERM sorting domain-containing protein [Steroidobacteraceae bacterium]